MLVAAFGSATQRMATTDAADFTTRLPDAVARYGATGIWLLAERVEPVGAVAFFGPGTTQHPLFQGNTAHIQLLGVLPVHTRSGVAHSLMAECLSRTLASGASELLLQTSEFMPEARRLYERLGFTLRRELPPVWGAPSYLYGKVAS
jgi:ribosomal protein S18 acetylase RimI-like enzyme